MDKLCEVRLNGKMWRLLRSWYEGGSRCIKIDGRLSVTYSVGRGVKQGSVLSPALFLLVMGPLLRELQASGLGLSINNFHAGGFLHVNDVRTLASSKESLEAQVAMVKEFDEMNFLKLNVGKCEVVMFSRGCSVDVPECVVDGSVLPAGDIGKCLGF